MTLVLLISTQPQVLWLQLAPTLLLYVAYLYKLLFNHQVYIIADCHNVVFRDPWIRFPGVVALLNRCDMTIVHNYWVKEQAEAAGVSKNLLYVLEDRPAILDSEIALDCMEFAHPWILFPCSFNADEPIESVLVAAGLLPDITFVITGNQNRGKGIHNLSDIPRNVKLTGFLPKIEFDTVLRATDAILGLTLLEGVQVCTANEAVGASKPLILSKTKLLKELFYQGAVYVDPHNPASIAQGCEDALLRKGQLTQEITELRSERNERWLVQAKKIDPILKDVKADIY